MANIYDWDSKKNEALITTRGVSFEEVISAIENGDLLDIIEHPNQKKYGHQKIYVVELNGYVYLVPFVQDKNVIFLKTIIPNRKAQRKYLGS
jgi:uncharacterized DUF497 family protein